MAASTSPDSSHRGRAKGQTSWAANQNHFPGETKQHHIGLRASALYSVLVAEVDVLFFSVIRLREHVTSVGLHDVIIPPAQTVFSIFNTSIKRINQSRNDDELKLYTRLTAQSWHILLIYFNHFFSNTIMTKKEK